MRQKKNTTIILVFIIILLLILIAGIAYIYFATDLFKSNKDLFLKYAGQITSTESNFIDNQLSEYMEKKAKTPYENEGTLSFNVTSEDEEDKYENVNDFNITFSGQVDTANLKSTQSISLNYSDSVKFPINYKKTNNSVGLQTDYVGSKFLAIELDEAPGITDSDIAKIQKITQLNFSEEEKQYINDTYITKLYENLTDEKFTAVEPLSGINGYKLTLTIQEIKNISKQLLEILKQDTLILNKINEIYELTEDNINELIEGLDETSNTENLEEKIEITVYELNGNIRRISVGNEELKIQIEKVNEGDTVNYSIILENATENSGNKITVNLIYSGLSSMQTINEKYELIVETGNNSTKYQLDNNISFANDIEVEEITSENAVMLTDYDQQQLSTFLQAVIERIINVNKQQMEKLGLEENENPIITLISSMGISSETTNSIGIDTQSFSESEISSFNQKFEVYESTNQRAVTVKGLLSEISLINQEDDETKKITEIHYNGSEYEATENIIQAMKNDIDTEASYRVEFEKDQETGLIYRAVINKK